jgi:hypothetical protein
MSKPYVAIVISSIGFIATEMAGRKNIISCFYLNETF